MKRIVLSLFLLIAISSLSFPFGKNKVNYSFLNWYSYDIGDFFVYIDSSQKDIYKEILRSIKLSEENLYKYINREITQKFNVIVFPNQIDFQNNNIVDSFIDEGTGGFTEGIKDRLVIPMSGNWYFFQRVLQHEMVHVFQFDALKTTKVSGRNVQNRNIPLWLIEGMAEYYSVDWDYLSEEILRDITLNDMIIPIKRLSDVNQLRNREYFLIYKQSQAFLKFIGDKYGKNYIYKLFLEYVKASENPFKAIFNTNLTDIEKAFVVSKRKEYFSLAKDFDEIMNFASSVEGIPYGDDPYDKFIPGFVKSNIISFLTYKDIYPKVVLFDLDKQKILKEIVVGGFNEDYLEFRISRNNISCSTNDKIVFVSRSGGEELLNFYDLELGTLEKIRFQNIKIISSPDISVDGKFLAFSGFDGKYEDIYVYNIEKKELTRLTEDIFYDSQPRFSIDGNYMYFISSRNKDSLFSPDTDIYRINLKTREIEKFLDIGGVEQDPFLSRDNRFMLFVSTIDGVRNIFVYDFENQKIYRVSRVITGAYSPKLSSDGSKIIFSSQNRLFSDIYITDFKPITNETFENNTNISKESLSKFETERKLIESVSYKKSEKYIFTPTIDYITGAMSFSSDMGLLVLLGIGMSDIMGDHRFSIWLNNVYFQNNYLNLEQSLSEINFVFNYENYKNRFNLGFEAYNVRDYFYYLMNFVTLPSFFYYAEPIYYSKVGLAGKISYPFSMFSRLDFTLEHSRYYDKELDSILEKYSFNTLSLGYFLDRTLWSITGPVDGVRMGIMFNYSPIILEKDKEIFTGIFDIRDYVMITPFDNLALRFVSGHKFGRNAEEFPFYIGGIGTVRGFDYKQFSGTTLFLANLELRIALVRYFLGPFNFELPMIFGNLFIDTGIVANDISKVNIFGFDRYGNTVFKDLKVGVGMGIGILLGVGFKFKIDFASPFDGVRLKEPQEWLTHYQIGYEF